MGNLNDIEYVLQVSEARGNPVTEKRAAVRVVPTRAVTIALATGGDERLAYGVIEDISCGGARVVSDTAPPVGQWVGVALSFPREKQLFETRCRIVWLRPGPLVDVVMS